MSTPVVPQIVPAVVEKQPDGTYAVRIQHTVEGSVTIVHFPSHVFGEALASTYAAFLNGEAKVETEVKKIAGVVDGDAKAALKQAKKDADQLVADAEVEGEKLVADAKVEAAAVKAEAEKVLADAKVEADKLIAEARVEVAKIEAEVKTTVAVDVATAVKDEVEKA